MADFAAEILLIAIPGGFLFTFLVYAGMRANRERLVKLEDVFNQSLKLLSRIESNTRRNADV